MGQVDCLVLNRDLFDGQSFEGEVVLEQFLVEWDGGFEQVLDEHTGIQVLEHLQDILTHG